MGALHERRRRVLFTLGLACRALTAHAQTVTPSVDTLPTVRVTVLRTPFDRIAAPFSIAIVPARDAAVARPGIALDEVLNGVAGVQVDNRLNFALGERIAMRGLGARAQFGVRGVRAIVDGIPATLADGQTVLSNVDLVTLDHAEVLRGPASALYGNASGGVIILESAPGPPVSFAPRTRLITGSDDLRHFQLGGGGRADNLSYVVSGDRLDDGGYRAFSDARLLHGNSVMAYTTDRADVKLVINSEHHEAHNPGGLTDSLLHVNRRAAAPTNVAQQTGERGGQTQVGLSTRVALGNGELRMAGYILQRALVNPIPPSIIDLHRHAGGVRTAYAVTVGRSEQSLTAMIGGESDLQRDDRQNHVNARGTRGALTLNQREHVTSVSPFAQLTAELGRMSLFGGVRHDRFRFAAADRLITANNPDDSGIRWLSATSPSIGASYALLPILHMYANISTAFQTPTTTELANRPNGAGGFNPTLQPEHVHARELGVYGIMAQRISYHADVYRMRVTGELIPFEVPSFAGRQFYRNSGIAEHRGVEVDGRAVLTSLLSARMSYASTLTRIIADTANAGGNVGRRIPGVAPHLFTVALDAGDTERWLASLELRAQDRTPVNDANRAFSAGYAVTNFRVRTPPMGSVAVFGGVGNVWNVRYNTSVVVNATGGRYYEPGAGRTVYLGGEWAGAGRLP